MRLLVDTHAFLWFLANDPQLSPLAKSFLKEPTNELLLSVASPWEIAIKVSLGKLSIPGDVETFIEHHMAMNDIELVDIRLRHDRGAARCGRRGRPPEASMGRDRDRGRAASPGRAHSVRHLRPPRRPAAPSWPRDSGGRLT
ncbi:type II toxin-antitoxin system VapC family toxin [Sorangium sp. So ce1182]|uniref:type II toxin-antitoxin system VapC family toxin n=1 Tax=Sorangium sp. So ce1182 TaxID=3133334 RepID=UPI003F5FA5B5